jgi:hypothetical protein
MLIMTTYFCLQPSSICSENSSKPSRDSSLKSMILIRKTNTMKFDNCNGKAKKSARKQEKDKILGR